MPLYCRHALQQMSKRGISKQDVQFCLAHYDIRLIPKKGYELYRAKLPNGTRLQVIFDRNKNQVVTAVLL